MCEASLKKIILLLIVCAIGVPTSSMSEELLIPNPEIPPEQVVYIQVSALQNNDLPRLDFGITQTWNFAHPRNRAATGPLKKFIQMLKGPQYRKLINHKAHKISMVTVEGNRAFFVVSIETNEAQIYNFDWILERVDAGQYDNCWMTISVSTPYKIEFEA